MGNKVSKMEYKVQKTKPHSKLFRKYFTPSYKQFEPIIIVRLYYALIIIVRKS